MDEYVVGILSGKTHGMLIPVTRTGTKAEKWYEEGKAGGSVHNGRVPERAQGPF